MSGGDRHNVTLVFGWFAAGVFWCVWGAKGFWWGVLAGVFWPAWFGYRAAEALLR